MTYVRWPYSYTHGPPVLRHADRATDNVYQRCGLTLCGSPVDCRRASPGMSRRPTIRRCPDWYGGSTGQMMGGCICGHNSVSVSIIATITSFIIIATTCSSPPITDPASVSSHHRHHITTITIFDKLCGSISNSCLSLLTLSLCRLCLQTCSVWCSDIENEHGHC